MPIEIKRYEVLSPALAESVYVMYADVFAPINVQAAQRHLLTGDEFRAVATDARISKYLAYEGGGLVGMSTLLNDLDAWPLLSPAYFRNLFPEHYEANQIWYVGFLGARPEAVHVFAGLVGEMFPRVRGGITAMDFCTWNVLRNLPRVTLLMLLRLDKNAQFALLDAQSTYAYRFDGLGFPAVPVAARQ